MDKAQREADEAEAERKRADEQLQKSCFGIVKGIEEDANDAMAKEREEKKQAQRPKVDKVIVKVEAKKAKAAEQFKLGQYGDAVATYKACTVILESAAEDFPLFKQELNQVEATIFNNMAACSKKELNSKQEVEFTTKVIERQEYLTDKQVLLKAYLRRGLAYEQLEKFLLAREDMHSVKELQFDNKQASQCLARVNKAIKQEYGDNVPVVPKNAPIKMAPGASSSSETKQAEASPEQKQEPA